MRALFVNSLGLLISILILFIGVFSTPTIANQIAISADGSHIARYGIGSEVIIIDNTGQVRHQFIAPSEGNFFLRFGTGNDALLIGTNWSTQRFGLSNRKMDTVVLGRRAVVSPTGRVALIRARTGAVLVKQASGDLIAKLTMLAGDTALFSDDGRWLAFAALRQRDQSQNRKRREAVGQVKIYYGETGKMATYLRLAINSDQISAMSFSSDGKRFAVAYRDEENDRRGKQMTRILVYNTADWQKITEFSIKGFFAKIAMNRSGDYVAVATRGRGGRGMSSYFNVYNVTTKSPLSGFLNPYADKVFRFEGLIFSPKGEYLWAALADRENFTMRRYDLATADYVDIRPEFTERNLNRHNHIDGLMDGRMAYAKVTGHCVRWVEVVGGIFGTPSEFIQGTVVGFEGENIQFKVTEYDTRWISGGGMLSRGRFDGQWIWKGRVLTGYKYGAIPCS